MTKEEIIELACQSFGGIIKKEKRDNFINFAKLVAEHEREACAELIPPQYFHFRDWIRARGKE